MLPYFDLQNLAAIDFEKEMSLLKIARSFSENGSRFSIFLRSVANEPESRQNRLLLSAINFRLKSTSTLLPQEMLKEGGEYSDTCPEFKLGSRHE